MTGVNHATARTPQADTSSPPVHYAALSVGQKALVCAFITIGIAYLSWRPSTFNSEALLFSAALYAAELFGFVCALLYIFMCWRLQQRTPPSVEPGVLADVFVPTINESVDMVRRTLLSAKRMDHVGEVWLLDDGNRPAMHALADEIGCRYLARSDNSHAKAGNLNHALAHCDAHYIAIFDADHAPAADFLTATLGFFREPRVAFVQTPQDFYNLDSFQHRMDRKDHLVWSEQTLFFRVIQPGKDRLNAAFFCGSCAVIRRHALDDIGGFATGTVTEDIHTSLKLHKRGWRSVYYARALAFGLAPSSVVPFLKQRLRWGQGAMQVWRREGVLTAGGLDLGQRVAYLATMLAYFEGWQRAMFFLAPVLVLTLGVMPIAELNHEFLLRFLPYYLLTFWVFEEVSRGFGRSLLTEQYNMMRFAVFITATFGLFLKRLRFVVTPKRMGETDATARAIWPQYVVLGLNALAIPAGILLHAGRGALPTGALVANLIWAAATAAIAIAAIRFTLRVATFRRQEYRFPLPVPLCFNLPSGTLQALATDISPRGFRLSGLPDTALQPGQGLAGELLLPSGRLPIRATVREVLPMERRDAGSVAAGCELHWDTVAQLSQLELFLFGSDLQWRLNGLEDRIRTPLERLRDLWHRTPRTTRRLATQRWQPLLYATRGDDASPRIGFISAADTGISMRTLVTLDALPEDAPLRAEVLTANGPRPVHGTVGAAERLETRAAPLYLYRLSA